MNKRTCINLHYLETKEREAFRRLHLKERSLENQVALIQEVSPHLRVYVCGRCPSYNLCRFISRYGIKEDRIRNN